MAEFSIPVDLFNPGQVFACLGFLEAADMLCGDAEGGFDWRDETEIKFCLQAKDDHDPFEIVLDFLAAAEAKAMAPKGWQPNKGKEKLKEELRRQQQSEVFPSASPETSSALPIRIARDENQFVLSHWADGSSRNEFKLYAGNRSALDIATAMLSGTFDRPAKRQKIPHLRTRGISHLYKERRKDLIKRPFDVTTSMSGSFNFDPRGAWTAIDAGYSPNEHKHQVAASPVVEILAAWGLENARPDEFQTRKVRYAAWGALLPPILARTALAGRFPVVLTKQFHFELDLSGKNKIVTFAEEEITDG